MVQDRAGPDRLNVGSRTATAGTKVAGQGQDPSEEDPSSRGDIAISPAAAGDLDALSALERAAFSGDRLSRRSLARFLRQEHGIFLVARAGAALAGYALVLTRRGSAKARLYSIAVDAGMRGRGVARRLLAAAERAALDAGAGALRLEVRADNGAAIPLYFEAGYRQFGSREAYYEDGAAALRLEKDLVPPRGEGQHPK